jgi:CRP/FNR family transcriptional regulator, cyclic AMP receptor protein
MFTLGSEESYKDGDVIIKEGSSGDWVYVVLSGSVEVSKMLGGSKLILDLLKDGEVFGEMSFLAGGNRKRSATVTAVGDTTVGTIDRNSLDMEFNKLSSDFRSILVSSIRRFKQMMERTSEFSGKLESRSAQRSMPKSITLGFKDPQAFLKSFIGTADKGGLFIRTPKPLKKGESFFLNLQLPNIQPIKIKCAVEWANAKEGAGGKPAGMKTTFIEMSPQDAQILKGYLSKLGMR